MKNNISYLKEYILSDNLSTYDKNTAKRILHIMLSSNKKHVLKKYPRIKYKNIDLPYGSDMPLRSYNDTYFQIGKNGNNTDLDIFSVEFTEDRVQKTELPITYNHDDILLSIAKTEWFDDEIVATKHGDFFDKRSINYNKKSKSVTSNDLF